MPWVILTSFNNECLFLYRSCHAITCIIPFWLFYLREKFCLQALIARPILPRYGRLLLKVHSELLVLDEFETAVVPTLAVDSVQEGPVVHADGEGLGAELLAVGEDVGIGQENGEVAAEEFFGGEAECDLESLSNHSQCFEE